MVNHDHMAAETIFKKRRQNKTLFKAILIITEYFAHTSVFNDLIYYLIYFIAQKIRRRQHVSANLCMLVYPI